MRKKRLFVGIDVPEELQEEIAESRFDVRGVRWIDPDKYHLTLQFVGPVSAVEEKALADELASIEAFQTRISLGPLVVLPSSRNPRVIAVDATADEQLEQLQAAVRAAVKTVVDDIDERPFRPHITIGRARRPNRKRLLERLDETPSVERILDADAFHLYHSRPDRGGVSYDILRSYKLSSA